MAAREALISSCIIQYVAKDIPALSRSLSPCCVSHSNTHHIQKRQHTHAHSIQSTLTSCINHIHISEGWRWPHGKWSVGPQLRSGNQTCGRVITKEGRRENWCSLSINVAAKCFSERLTSSYCPYANFGQYWSDEESLSHAGRRWAESWKDQTTVPC